MNILYLEKWTGMQLGHKVKRRKLIKIEDFYFYF